jgi:hypothetical protein
MSAITEMAVASVANELARDKKALQAENDRLRAVLAGWFAVVDGNPNAEAADLLNVWRTNWHESTRKLLTQ